MKFLKRKDPVLHQLIKGEKYRQENSIELIASENFTSKSVQECLGTCLTNKYSEGYPGRRYYGGNEYIDKIENLCIARALSAYRLNSSEWGVNVQCYSGSIANMSAYLGLIKPGDTISGLSLPSGGHLTHGFETKKKKISHTSLIFNSVPYKTDENGFIDYSDVKRVCEEHKPKLLICGYSAYSREIDYRKFKEYADSCGAILLCDMSHYSGLVATGFSKESPFDYCDVVTTTTHKTLRGPRSAMIFYKQKYKNAIDMSVFPGTQGGPHNHQIAAVAHQLLEVQTPEFTKYIQRVVDNARYFSRILKVIYKYDILTGGTDNHMFVVDLRSKGVTGAQVEYICDLIGITINKNTVPSDTSALNPSGIRLGTSAITTKNFTTGDIAKVCHYIDSVVRMCARINEDTPLKSKIKMKDFKELCNNKYKGNIENMKKEVSTFVITRKRKSFLSKIFSF